MSWVLFQSVPFVFDKLRTLMFICIVSLDGYYWDDLVETGIDQYLIALGWNEGNWDGDGPAPETENLFWGDMTADERSAAGHLCYFKEIWNEVSIDEWGQSTAP